MPENEDTTLKFIKASEIAQRANITSRTVVRDLADGKLRGSKIKNTYLINQEDAEAYIAKKTKTTSPEETRSYLTVSELARRIGRSYGKVAFDIRSGKLKVFQERYISREHAEAYIARVAAEEHQETVPMVGEDDIPVSDQCDCCGAMRGNILGDIDEITKRQYGYLCMKCHRLVRAFQGDIDRMRYVLRYIEKTRLPQV